MSSGSGPEQIGLRYLSLANQVRRIVDEHMSGAGPSLARTKVLMVLGGHGALRQAALAAELGYAPRSVTQAVDALERDGLVERTSDPGDRRCKVVVLTPEGRAALAAGTAAGENILRQVFGALGPGQRADLDALLDAIEAAATAATAATVTAATRDVPATRAVPADPGPA
ncbi:MarR family winged helix-turn-helix transcriptional regulator [Streptomyces sp. NPDC056244]|uniref:MarR family winged helix-turn-helix transcriptional regulator n=1 Tax=Streptomyces sp. NPDC056244 TaxID=3345762 RepID=UPI0035DD50B6